MDNALWINLSGVIREIHKLGYNNYAKGINIHGDKIDENLIIKYWSSQEYVPSIELGKLENILREKEGEQILINEAIYLPPLTEYDSDCIPVLHVKCDLDENSDHHFRFTLIKYSNQDEEPCVVGYRFEKHNDQPDHNYWHVQLNDSLGYSSNLLEKQDLPGQVPCIPTIALDPISFLFTALFSIYGKKAFTALLRKISVHTKYVSHLDPYLR